MQSEHIQDVWTNLNSDIALVRKDMKTVNSTTVLGKLYMRNETERSSVACTTRHLTTDEEIAQCYFALSAISRISMNLEEDAGIILRDQLVITPG
jgi:hypothetical protein